jgi:putative nucleotidyltransferase with HDIG domain
MRILFVDDEKNILTGLKRMLHSMKNEWKMFFVQSGLEAVELLKVEEIDLMVTDMKMPGMDGLSLLEYVNEQFPHIVRIILTGHTNDKYIIKSVKTSHQFILKPCRHDELISRINKVYSLRKYLVSPELKRIITGIDKIPALPENYIRLEKELNSKEPSLAKMCEIIEKEPALSAKILQVVNSAYFNLAATVFNIQQALNILGINSIRSLVLYMEIFRKTPPLKTKLFSIKQLWKHSMYIANVSSKIYETLSGDKFTAKHAYIAGLLHDIGYLLISQVEGYDENINKIMEEENIDIHNAEIKWKNISHAEIGSYLLSVWNLPEPIIHAVADHHSDVDDLENIDFAKSIFLAQLWEKSEIEFTDFMQNNLSADVLNKLKNSLAEIDNAVLAE